MYRINDYWLLEFTDNNNFVLQTDSSVVFPEKFYLDTKHTGLNIMDLPRVLEKYSKIELSTYKDYKFFTSIKESDNYMKEKGYTFVKEAVSELSDPPGIIRSYAENKNYRHTYYRISFCGEFYGYTRVYE